MTNEINHKAIAQAIYDNLSNEPELASLPADQIAQVVREYGGWSLMSDADLDIVANHLYEIITTNRRSISNVANNIMKIIPVIALLLFVGCAADEQHTCAFDTSATYNLTKADGTQAEGTLSNFIDGSKTDKVSCESESLTFTNDVGTTATYKVIGTNEHGDLEVTLTIVIPNDDKTVSDVQVEVLTISEK